MAGSARGERASSALDSRLSVVGRETALMNNGRLVRSLSFHLKQTISIRLVNYTSMTHSFPIQCNVTSKTAAGTV